MKRTGKLSVILIAACWWAASPAPGQDNEAEERKELERLREERRHRVLDQHGFPSVGGFPLARVAEYLRYPENEVSLIAYPADRAGGNIVVYLINDTDKPLEAAIHPTTKVFQEIRVGEHWVRSQSFSAGCGNMPPPGDLPPGYARVLTAPDPSLGDMEAEIRYCLSSWHLPPLVTDSFKGRISSKEYDEAGKDDYATDWNLVMNVADVLRDGRQGSGRIAGTPEELVAAVEIARCHDKSWKLRESVQTWLAEKREHIGLSPECAAALHTTLGRPWDRVQDDRACFRRCFDALSSPRDAEHPYGSPERCRAVVWRYLVRGSRSGGAGHFVNPERWAAREELEASGNPWGAGREELVRLVELASEAVRSGDMAERAAARELLLASWITWEAFPDERFRECLDESSGEARWFGYQGLLRRGRRAEMIGWLIDHREVLGNELFRYWDKSASGHIPIEAWEVPVMLTLAERDPYMVFYRLGMRYRVFDLGGPKAPAGWHEPVRAYLLRELKGEREAPGGESPATASFAPRGLSSVLQLLAHWEDPGDTELLRAFLDHPEVNYTRVDETTVKKSYSVREKACELLTIRGEKVPRDVVLQEDVPAADARGKGDW